MMIEERHRKIVEAFKENPNIDIKELAERLFVSEPTVRRDLTELHNKGIITKKYGGAILNTAAAYREIPFFLRENEKSTTKSEMGKKAATLVKDGMVIMLDGSTSAFHIVPYLARFENLTVVTSGAKTALALAEANIRTFCTGGEMIIHSFSYVGEQAESFVRNVNADLLFFSCHGLDLRGRMTDNAIEEANLRKVMFSYAAKKILLCDSSKFGKTCFYNMGNIADMDGIITDAELPDELAKMIKKS